MPSRFQPLSGFERATFGLVGWLEATKITLPLHAVGCRFEIRGELAGVEVDQVFHQSSAEPLDCCYTFPLPAGGEPGRGKAVVVSMIGWAGRSLPADYPGRQRLVSSMAEVWGLVLPSPAAAAADPKGLGVAAGGIGGWSRL